MDKLNSDTLNALDNIRLTRGADNLTSYFYRLLRNSAKYAIDLINDENLCFTSFFLLQPMLNKANLSRSLSIRNQNALEIIPAILERKSSTIDHLSYTSRQSVHSTLKWMLETGYSQDGLNDQYERVLDSVSVLLLKQYKDKTILPTMISMLFSRYRKGHFTYDLIWAYLESCDTFSLPVIADRLNSTHPRDVELARKLLNFVPCIYTNPDSDCKNQALCVRNWIEENLQFLYYTGESFHQTCNPMPYVISYEAKYLCKPVSVETGKIPVQLTENEALLLDKFRKLDHYSQMLLSSYSYMLYQSNLHMWSSWLHSPIQEQLRTVRVKRGGEL